MSGRFGTQHSTSSAKQLTQTVEASLASNRALQVTDLDPQVVG
jgi:hypothetical protein